MRHPPSSLTSFSLHRIAADMSIRPPFRGGCNRSRGRGRGRRSFSERAPPSAADPAISVSGDSHFQSVRDTNSIFLRRHPYNDDNNPRNFNSPHKNSNNNGGLQFQPQIQSYKSRPSPLNRSFNQPPARTRPADYRIWEYAKHPPPAHSERFVVLSYNMLADYLATNHRNLYFHIPRRFMSWDWRKRNILFELGLWSPDIMCFQEVDKFRELEEDLRHRGYSGIWKMRTGEAIDGCAIFWRTSRFKLVYEECIEFNKLAMRDNVAQICVLESLTENRNGKKLASSESTVIHNRVVICNIHVLYNPKRGEIKLGQVRVLLERAHAVSRKWDDASVVLCGDFNCTPKSPVYNFISEQKLDVSELERVNVSGQASAEIRPPSRQYGHHARGQLTGYISSPAMIQNISVDEKQITSVDKQNVAESILGNPPTKKRLSESSSEPSHNLSLLDVSEKDCNDSLNNMRSGGLSGKATHSLEDPCNSKENIGSPTSVSTDNLKDEGHSTNSDNSTDHNTSALSDDQSDDCCSISSSVPADVDMLSPAGDMNSCVVDAKVKPGPTSIYEASEPYTSSSFNDIDVKRSGLSLNKMDKSVEDNEDLAEDAETFMSELNNDKDACPSDLGDFEDPSSTLESQVVNVNKPSYDPSVWTPMEIATATGNANNSVLEHLIKLGSTYTEVEDRSGTRDSNGEPLVTSYSSCFMGTVDYIWRSEGLHTVKVLAPIPKSAMLPTGGFPSKKWGSDHIALASELAFAK